MTKPNILITNDDGIDSHVLHELKDELNPVADVWIFVPDRDRSTTGHGITLTRPLEVKEVENQVFTCDGLPADCVVLASHLLKEVKFDLVVSGINKGANLGSDLYYSGTVAAAREAAFRGLKSIATSLVLDTTQNSKLRNYQTPQKFIRRFVENKLYKLIEEQSFLNFNFPNIESNLINKISRTLPCMRKYDEKILPITGPKDQKLYWFGGYPIDIADSDNSDYLAVKNGQVAFTQLNLNHSCQIIETELDKKLSEIML